MSQHTRATATRTAHSNASRKIRSIVRLFGRETARPRPVSIEADAKLRTAHVRAAAFRPALY